MNLWKKEEKTQTFDSLRVEHARRHRSYFHCHAKVRAYARCGAIRQSVGHNRADSRHGTKYANSTDVGNGPAKTINATDCMCSYIDGSIKISARTRVESGGRDGEAKRKEERRNATWCEWLRYFATYDYSIRFLCGFISHRIRQRFVFVNFPAIFLIIPIYHMEILGFVD